MLTRVLLLGLLCSSALDVRPGAAQEGVPGDGWAGEWVLMAGWQRLDVDGLNERLNATGYPTFPGSVWSVGGGGWATRGRFLFGGNGHALLAAERTAAGGAFRADLTGGYGQGDVGYVVHAGERLDVYPSLGFGAGAVTLEIVEQRGASFDEILNDPRTMTRQSAWGFLFDVAATARWRLTGVGYEGGTDEGTHGGLSLGVRVGYALSPGDWDWEASGGPGFALRGAYVRVMVGGWVR